jgi:hypothetical protein
MYDNKSLFASKAVWGGAVAILAGVASLLGYTVDPAAQTSIVELATGVASLVGGALAVWGRIKATKRIH